MSKIPGVPVAPPATIPSPEGPEVKAKEPRKRVSGTKAKPAAPEEGPEKPETAAGPEPDHEKSKPSSGEEKTPDGSPTRMKISDIGLCPGIAFRSPEGSGRLVEETVQEYVDKRHKLPPIVVSVSRNPDLHNKVIAGHTRLKAFQQAGESEIPVTYVEVADEKQLILEATKSNLTHGLRPQRADYVLMAKSLEKVGLSRNQIAETLECSPASVTSYLGPKEKKFTEEEILAVLQDSNLSVAEMAEKLGMTKSNIYARRSRLKEKAKVTTQGDDSAGSTIPPEAGEAQASVCGGDSSADDRSPQVDGSEVVAIQPASESEAPTPAIHPVTPLANGETGATTSTAEAQRAPGDSIAKLKALVSGTRQAINEWKRLFPSEDGLVLGAVEGVVKALDRVESTIDRPLNPAPEPKE